MSQVPATFLETAACVWEDILVMLGDIEKYPLVEECRNKNGTWGLRMTAIGWCEAIDKDWQAVDCPDGINDGQYGESFDWDFVPGWIAENIEWSESGDLPTRKRKA